MIKRKLQIKNKSSNSNKLLNTCLFVFVLSILARIYFASSYTAKNVQMRDLYVQKSELEQQITRLKYDNLRLSSLDNLETRAKHLGFIYQKDTLLSLDLTVSAPLALR